MDRLKRYLGDRSGRDHARSPAGVPGVLEGGGIVIWLVSPGRKPGRWGK